MATSTVPTCHSLLHPILRIRASLNAARRRLCLVIWEYRGTLAGTLAERPGSAAHGTSCWYVQYLGMSVHVGGR